MVKIAFGMMGMVLAFLMIVATPARTGSVYNYDRLDRLALVRHPDCSMDVFSYNEAGQKTRVRKISEPSLSALEISGPLEVAENAHAYYTVYARYPDEIVAPVSGAVFSVESSVSKFDDKENGLLLTGNVDADHMISIHVSYQDCSGARTAAVDVLIKKEALSGASSCTGYPVRVVKNGKILSCHTSEAAGYESAHHGSLIQSAMPSSGIELTTWSDKDVIIEGYEDATFTAATRIVMKNLELNKGTLIVR